MHKREKMYEQTYKLILQNRAEEYGQKAIDAINRGFPENTFCYHQESPEYLAKQAASCAIKLVDFESY